LLARYYFTLMECSALRILVFSTIALLTYIGLSVLPEWVTWLLQQPSPLPSWLSDLDKAAAVATIVGTFLGFVGVILAAIALFRR
jgi:hypothetical protein